MIATESDIPERNSATNEGDSRGRDHDVELCHQIMRHLYEGDEALRREVLAYIEARLASTK